VAHPEGFDGSILDCPNCRRLSDGPQSNIAHQLAIQVTRPTDLGNHPLPVARDTDAP
jgi:hypothetical protein